ncbi:hypothetical protein HanOQP8_Chr12g0444021 [Helianthus annuus]|nr:hypothetical protein HanOQP8_Chr12g0444021 [Helianthus annuus]
MEAVMMNSTGDNKHRFGNLNRNFVTNRSLFPYPSDNILLSSFLAGGYFTGNGLPSYPPAVSVFRPPQNLHHYRQQPPLLPLPILTPLNHQNTNISRCNSASNYNNNNNIRLSPPRINKVVNKNVKNRVRDQSLTPKKSKNQKKDSKREVVDLAPPVAPTVTAEEKEAPPPENTTESLNNDEIGPDLKEDVIPRVLSSSMNNCDDIVDEFSGSSVFTPSPPPSSLPLPTFFLRPKVSCKAEASGVDVGATDSLRRLLRL